MAVMSAERSSSAVRNLRSIFESKETEAISTQGQRKRSESTEPSREGRRPLSKVRSSFVAVESGRVMDESAKNDTIVEQEADSVRAAPSRSSASLRRPSFSANTHDSEELGLKKVITDESERRGRDENVPEMIPEAAVESTPGTPLAQAIGDLRPSTKTDVPKSSKLSDLTPLTDPQPPANPDKPVAGAEEDAGNLRPADLTNKAEVSGEVVPADKALPSRSKPAAVLDEQKAVTPKSSKVESQATPILKEVPAKQISSSKPPPKADAKPLQPTPVSNGVNHASSVPASKPTTKTLDRKASRPSLAAAASPATAAAPKASASSRSEHPDLPAKPKPRETTKPLDISPHLLAPTAASRARHEVDTAASTTVKDTHKNVRASTGSSTAKATPRTSLARQSRPGSRTSHTTATRKPPVPVADGSFLERMTRPTAASQNRAQEKFEPKAAAAKKVQPVTRKAAPARPKAFSPTASAQAQAGDHTASSSAEAPQIEETASTTSPDAT